MRYVAILLFVVIFIGGCASKQAITLDKKLKAQTPLDIKLHYTTKGEGEDLLLLHGLGSSGITFNKILPSLSKRFRVFVPDLKGFGKSPKPRDGNYSIYDQYLVVKNFIIKHNIKHPIIIGHSMGGGVALLLALDTQIAPKKLILIDVAAYKQRLPKLLRYANIPIFGMVGFYLLPSSYEVMDGYRYAFYDNSKIPKDIVKELANNLSSQNAKYAFLTSNRELIPDDIDKISKRYKEIDIPTLIIWGDNDIVIKKSKAYKLHKDIPNSKLHIIKRCGHIPQEEKPKELLKILNDFL